MILQHDEDPNSFAKNKIVLDDDKLRQMELLKLKNKLKESFQEIGEEIDNLFQSNFFEDENDLSSIK